MKAITVRKNELRVKVQENRDAHRTIFEEAVEGYKKQAVELLEDHIKAIKKGKVQRVYVSLPEPEDHTSDYDRVLTMIDMAVGEEIELDERDFASYIMDDWAWKRQFLESNSTYSAMAASQL